MTEAKRAAGDKSNRILEGENGVTHMRYRVTR